jgi:hypothetical protein
MSTPEKRAADIQRVREAIVTLGEHFDTVQVFVTRHEAGESDGTEHIGLGAGNFFARYGQIHQWMAANDQEARELTKRQIRGE